MKKLIGILLVLVLVAGMYAGASARGWMWGKLVERGEITINASSNVASVSFTVRYYSGFWKKPALEISADAGTVLVKSRTVKGFTAIWKPAPGARAAHVTWEASLPVRYFDPGK